ncbi:MAG: AbgT family transporter [Clostridiales bacterium]|nr:AbgT family transporter [Clostridiales bacterium]
MIQKKGRGFTMPTAYSILLILILLVALITHCLGGEVRGTTLAELVMAIPRGILDAIDVCLFILILGGFLGVLAESGALDVGIQSLVHRLQGKEMILIPLLMILFSLGGTTYGMAEETMAFYSLITATMVASGFDALVGASVVLVGAGVGVLGSTVNPFAVSAAVDAYLSVYPDASVNYGYIILLGTVLWLTCLAAGIYFVMRYALQVKKKGRSLLSPSEKEQVQAAYSGMGKEEHKSLTGRQKGALWIFFLAFLVMVIALIPWQNFGIALFDKTAGFTGEPFGQWYFPELQAWFFLSAIAAGIVVGMSERGLINAFIRGAGDMLGVVFIIGISRGISVLMASSGLDLFVLHHAADLLENVSSSLFVVGSYLIYLALSFFIPSTSGLAAASMPTFAGLAASLGFSPEVMIMIFCAASGVVNLITPTSAVVMGGLSICRVEYPTWLRFIWKFLLFLAVLSLLILSVAMGLLQS